MNLDLVARRILDARMQAWADQNDVLVQFSNQTIEAPEAKQPEDLLVMQAYSIPGATTSRYLEGTDRRMSGIYQINIGIARNIGTGKAGRIANELADVFPNNIEMRETDAKLRIMSPLRVSAGFEGETLFIVPVDFEYLVETL